MTAAAPGRVNDLVSAFLAESTEQTVITLRPLFLVMPANARMTVG